LFFPAIFFLSVGYWSFSLKPGFCLWFLGMDLLVVLMAMLSRNISWVGRTEAEDGLCWVVERLM
jgi:hypothetical protein